MSAPSNWMTGVRPYFSKPILATFLFGISSGFPLSIVFSITSGWLKDNDVAKTEIGLFALIGTAYMLKFLWAPLIDGVKLGAFARRFGHRRSWLFLLNALMVGTLLFLSQLDPSSQLFLVAATTATLAVLSASQDIVIDAYRIEIVDDQQLGYGAAMINYGYRTGNLLVGYFGFIMADIFGWSAAIMCLSVLALSGVIAAFWIGEPDHIVSDEPRDSSFKSFLHHTVYLPFKEFMTRDNWLLILLFIMFLKLGDAMADFMMTPFQMELGFSKTEIANYSKGIGAFATYAGLFLGAIIYFRWGAYKSLFVTALLMMATNLVFIWAFYQGNDLFALGLSVGAEKFATGLGSTVVVAYLSALCNRNFTATQYALLSALAGVGRTILGSSGGYVVDQLGWVQFFLVTTAAAVPGILLLLLLWKRGLGKEDAQKGT